MACTNSDDKENDSGGSSNGGSSNGDNGGGTGCSGEITSCSMGSLDDAQYADACNLVLSAIDSEPGAKYECKEGQHAGLALTVNSKAQCMQQRPPKTCSVAVGKLIDCYKAAKTDACDAFAGACSFLFDKSTGCIP